MYKKIYSLLLFFISFPLFAHAQFQTPNVEYKPSIFEIVKDLLLSWWFLGLFFFIVVLCLLFIKILKIEGVKIKKIFSVAFIAVIPIFLLSLFEITAQEYNLLTLDKQKILGAIFCAISFILQWMFFNKIFSDANDKTRKLLVFIANVPLLFFLFILIFF